LSKEGMLAADPAEVAESLAAAEVFTKIEMPPGIVCDWYYFGDTVAPQKKLTSGQRENLKAVYREILGKEGISVNFRPDPAGTAAPEGVPAVTAVDVPAAPAVITVGTFDFGGGILHFDGDSAEYTDAAEAEQVLEPLAQFLIAHPEAQAHITGMTASGADAGWLLALSTARAEVVKETLVRLGVDSGRMQAVGVGMQDPSHAEDRDASGRLIPELAAKNRLVRIELY
jgi:outer membrane protein OmpA-like peptidoglycan-associated protein